MPRSGDSLLRLSLLAWIALGALLLSGCSNSHRNTVVNLGATASNVTSLVWLTQQLGLFSEQGVDVKIRLYPSGQQVLSAILEGEVQLGISAETPFVISSFSQPDLQLYASLGHSDNETRLLARRDHGISLESDLRGKTIAVQQGSSEHFFLSSFLLYHRLESDAVRYSFMPVGELPQALASGTVDVISAGEPILSLARDALSADQSVEFSVPGLYTRTYNLVGTADFTQQNVVALQGMLVALNKAVAYAESNPQQAIGLIADKLGLPPQSVASYWPQTRLTVTLNQGLMTIMQEQARWALDAGLIKQGRVSHSLPDFLSIMNSDPLSKAVPHAVGLMGSHQR